MNSIFKPKTLEECVKSDEISQKLYRWATYTKYAGIILCVLSIISGIAKAADMPRSFEDITLIAGIIGGVAALGSGLAESFLLEALASIVESNCIQARAALYMAFSNRENVSELPDELKF